MEFPSPKMPDFCRSVTNDVAAHHKSVSILKFSIPNAFTAVDQKPYLHSSSHACRVKMEFERSDPQFSTFEVVLERAENRY
jgi:hypothetical protein